MQKPSERIDNTIRNSQNMVVMHGNIFQDIAKILDELHERLKKVEERGEVEITTEVETRENLNLLNIP